MSRKIYQWWWFTLVEVLVVIVIAWILLGMVMSFWSNYLKQLNYQEDREHYISAINEFIMRWRTSNYYKGNKYTYIDITLNTTWVVIVYNTGDVTTSDCGTGEVVRDVVFKKSVLSGLSLSLPYTFRIEPYLLWCNTYCDGSSVVTGTVMSKSSFSDHESCYLFDGNLCKFTLTSCP